MAIKVYKPYTPTTRNKSNLDFSVLTKIAPEKSLTVANQRAKGRNNQGRITTRHKGGGHKRCYRLIDFKRNLFDIKGIVNSIEYDPNRTAFIALLHYADGEKRYILAPQGLAVGMTVISGEQVAPELGNCLPLKHMPLGTMVHNIELHPGQGGVIARSAGSSAQLNAKEEKYAVLKMPSGELRKVLILCHATVGSVSNSDHALETKGKAGANRWLGIRPRNRGVAMNPVDHPMGGGEGRSSGGHPRSRTGKYAKGEKTRKKKGSDKLIISRSNGSKLKTN